MRRPHRQPAGFNLAFLDIMACGLGAIILVFVLVKYHTATPVPPSSPPPDAELEAITDDLATRVAAIEKLRAELRRRTAAESSQLTDAAQLTRLTQRAAALESQLAQLTQSTPKTRRASNTESHLLGLRVSGARIIILLDSSASMAEQRLVDIIKIKTADTAAKKAAPKWQRAVAAARWMIERVPDGSQYLLIHYNAKPEFLSAAQWHFGDDAAARAAALKSLGEIYPHGGTDLHAALQLIKRHAATDIYLITDGLPTRGYLSTFDRFTACGTLIKSATTVSGKCRAALFAAAVAAFAGAGGVVNVALLPLEGDPAAAHAYWRWAAARGGTLISPSAEWP